MSIDNYTLYQEEAFNKHENICRRCGECCGASDGDPCMNLSKDNSGKYYCKEYENRFRLQKTESGKTFHCIPINELINNTSARINCSYRKSQ